MTVVHCIKCFKRLIGRKDRLYCKDECKYGHYADHESDCTDCTIVHHRPRSVVQIKIDPYSTPEHDKHAFNYCPSCGAHLIAVAILGRNLSKEVGLRE